MATLGGTFWGWSLWGRRIGRSIERDLVLACDRLVRCSFVRSGNVSLDHRWKDRCSARTLPVPHNCDKIHPSGPSLRHSRVQTSSPHPAHSHTNGPHCPRCDHPHIRLTRSLYYCIRQSNCCDRGAPPGHPTMGQTNISCTVEAASYHSSTYNYKTAFCIVPYAPSPRRPTL